MCELKVRIDGFSEGEVTADQIAGRWGPRIGLLWAVQQVEVDLNNLFPEEGKVYYYERQNGGGIIS